LLVKPTLIVSDIRTINLDSLWEHGIRALIFDLDNTLMAPRTGRLDDSMIAWLDAVEAKGFKCIILSNNKKQSYIKLAAEQFRFPIIGHAAKPRRAHARRALGLLGVEAHQAAMIGDRPLTDIWVGQRMGMYTILVDPLTMASEHRVVKVLRRLEKLFVRHH
jgi:HAD superfamily phosphatase (TIGR01668 family)